MISFFKLIRYKNLIMVLLTMVLTKYALLESFIENTYLSHFDFIILALSVVFITASGYIINDIYDVEIDKINKPDKIFIDITISLKHAWRSYFTLTLLGLFLGIYLSFNKHLPFYSLYFVVSVGSLFIYSKYLKSKILFGNFLVAILCALVIYLVFSFDFRIDKKKMLETNNIDLLHNFQFGKLFVKLFVVFSFLTTLIREIIKDIEDIDGDLKLKAKTLPIVLGRERASKIAFFFTSLLFIFLIIVVQFLQENYEFLSYYILFLLLPLVYLMYYLWIAKTKKEFSKTSNLMKIIMLFGILSMLLFKIY